MKRSLVIYLVLASATLPFLQTNLTAYTPEIKFEHISVDQGLSQSTVNAIIQDSKGFMWFGTQDGLNKFDGISFTIYSHDPLDPNSLSNSDITALFEDRIGNIWIGTNSNGLHMLDVEKEILCYYNHDSHQSKSLSHNSVNYIFEDNLGTIWICTDFGLNKFNRENDNFEHFLVDTVKAMENNILNIFEDSHGELWISTVFGNLYIFDRENNKFKCYTTVLGGLPDSSFDFSSAIYEDSQGVLWFGTFSKGLLLYNRDLRTYKFFKNDPHDSNSLINNFITNILEDQSGNIWIGTNGGGLNRFDRANESFTRYIHDDFDPYSLSNNIILALFEDRAGTLWIGTAGGGINKYSRAKDKFSHIKNLVNPNAINGYLVWSIFEDVSGALWVGTQSNGLNQYDPKQAKVTEYLNVSSDKYSLSYNEVTSIHGDLNGNIWIGTSRGGLNKLEKKSGEFNRFFDESSDPFSLSSNFIRCLEVDKNGSLWIGTYGGLNKLISSKKSRVQDKHGDWHNKITAKFMSYQNDSMNPNSLSDNLVTSIIEDMFGNLWIGTIRGGLNKFDKENEIFTSYVHDPLNLNSLSNNYVMSICEDRSGILWIGTAYGLNRFDPSGNKFSHYTTRNGLPNNVIYGILADDSNNLWISTNKGLSAFDRSKAIFRNYTIDDGLQSSEFNSGSSFKSNSGEMYFGGVNGFNIFHPDSIRDNQNIPPIVITSFKKFDKVVNFGKTISEMDEIELSFKDNFISFEFAALDYTNPAKNQYAYKLEGFNDEWIYCSTKRYASFTNLSPGKYIFRVKGSNSDGIWNEEGDSINIIITPPFWKTQWFLFLTSVFALSFILMIIYYLKKREKNKAELDKKISELKLQAMRAQMNPHFIFNTINSIQYFISSNEQKAAFRYLSKFSKLMRKILDNTEKSRVPISEEVDALKLYLELETLRFEGKFDYSVEIDPAIDIHNIEIPTLLIQPFVENAIHHGLRYKRSNGDLSIKLGLENGSVACMIQDNGIGIEKGLELREKRNCDHKSTGMKVSQERLVTLNALRKNGHGVEIVDLSNINEGTHGTMVKIVIPIDGD